MIQGDFHGVIGPEAERFSGGQFCFGVETLDDATGRLPMDTTPNEQSRVSLAADENGVNMEPSGSALAVCRGSEL